MKIKAEFLDIQRVPSMPDGTSVEPEQQPAARVIETEAAATLRGGAQDGKIVGAMPARFIFETTAGEAAQQVRRLCRGCKHFRRKAWNQYVAEADSPLAPMEKRRIVNEIRFAIASQTSEEFLAMHSTTDQNGEPDIDVEHALHSMGFCGVLSEITRDHVIMHPLASCPPEAGPVGGAKEAICTKERPYGFYEPKSLDAERAATREYDEIMRAAQGK